PGDLRTCDTLGAHGAPLRLRRLGGEERGGPHGAAAGRLVLHTRPPSLSLEDLELVVQAGEVLLHGRLRDDELRGDLSNRRRLAGHGGRGGWGAAGEQAPLRPAREV